LFFFALTPGPLKSIPAEVVCQSGMYPPQGQHGPICRTVGLDGFHGDHSASNLGEVEGSGVTLVDALPARSGCPREPLLKLTFDPAQRRGTLHRVSNSGRSLYYTCTPDGGFMASTHLRLLAQAGVRIEENESLLPELLMYRMVICPQTLAKNIRQLQAGETVEFTLPAEGRAFTTRSTGRFDPPREDPANFNERGLVENAYTYLVDAFERTNSEGARFGSLLSGGLDSTLLTKFAYDIYGVKESLSCSYPFEDPNDDIEENYALSAAANIGTKHTVYVPTMAEYLHGVIDTVYHGEQPMMHLQSVLLHLAYVKELAPRGINMVANGEGADGIFGLKTHRFVQYLLDNPGKRSLLGLPPVAGAIRAVATLTNRFGLVARMAGKSVDSNTPLASPKHIMWSDAVFGYWPWIKPYTGATHADVIRGRAQALEAYQQRTILEQISLTAFAGEGTQTQQIWSLIADPANIGVFYPFPNPKLVEAAYKAPWSYKLGEPKKALRDVARKLGIAEFVITRPKAAFGIRSERYGPRNSVLEPLIGVCAKAVPEEVLRALQSPEIYKAQTLWTLINLAIWRRLFVRGEKPAVLHEELDSELRRLNVHERFAKPGRVEPMIA
jgi:hypothetical protein